ncbi:carbohydrate-binding domain-containing protein [Adlercreutzia sp. ZJ242]|uniref:carbohydrate-binding domain-containing protein n=1 Tax=Adlercreutzia sp. ZJ242 TaxID=2709409 RepID=UPI0013ED5B7B|nr:carbohydrate-binding domain-containing protein [Adlercreutzia sp. ZJ242]
MAVLLAAALLSLAGCAAGDPAASSAAGASGVDASTSANAGGPSEAALSSDALAINLEAMDFDYSDCDKDASYDAAAATRVALAGDAASVEGAGASAEGSVITVTAAGTYVVSGELADGQIVVDAASEDKVQLVLDGARIHNADGPAIYVRKADKVFVTLAADSANALTDGADYVLDQDDEPNATLFSHDDLTINGTGSLEVTSAYRHAVCSKDDLVVTGGALSVSAAEDGLRGRDCVKIADGTFAITAGEDAVKSSNDEDGSRGFTCIDGGTFDITAGDDAVHAESVLRVTGGSVDVATCNEGLEAEQVQVSGGEVSIVANDDGVNAAARDTVTGGADNAPGVSEGSCLLQISGGRLEVASAGDALDSNGDLAITGGAVILHVPANPDDTVVDCDGSISLAGGTVTQVAADGTETQLTQELMGQMGAGGGMGGMGKGGPSGMGGEGDKALRGPGAAPEAPAKAPDFAAVDRDSLEGVG